ncbi:hypothetical protein LIER_42313 [Lithospermum erythrorhizon]|uniref:PAP/OAS1 substrate-binding-related domain-containing protein n=1 Tax=Lithospermum erythrorhizon TaxID=34254 RepID=A0AAV3RNN4_LITER
MFLLKNSTHRPSLTLNLSLKNDRNQNHYAFENSEYGENDLMLSEEFLRYFMDMFSVPTSDQTTKAFPPKHLNIIDPLKECNNLGRSVHRAMMSLLNKP